MSKKQISILIVIFLGAVLGVVNNKLGTDIQVIDNTKDTVKVDTLK